MSILATELEWPEGTKFFEIRCRLGILGVDGEDDDKAPDVKTLGGTVRITPRTQEGRIRILEPDGKYRVVVTPTLTFAINESTGRLVNTADYTEGVWVVDPSSDTVDPKGFTYSAVVTPKVGSPFTVEFDGSVAIDGVYDLANGVTVAPSRGTSLLESRIAKLEQGGALPDVSGLATKEEVDSLVYMTGEVRLVEEIPERIELQYKVLSAPPGNRWWTQDVVKEGVFTVKTSEFAEGYVYDEIECRATVVPDIEYGVSVDLFEKSTTGLKKLLAHYRWANGIHEVRDASGKKTPIPEGESSPAKALYDLVVKRLKEIEERERAEIPEAAVFAHNSEGRSLLAEVKSRHILSDGSAGPLSNVIERVDFEGSGRDRSLVLSVSDGRKIPLPMEVPDITLRELDDSGLKETPMSVVFQKGYKEARVKLSGSIGSVVYAPDFQKLINNPFLQVECIVHDGMGKGSPSHEVITIPLPTSLDSDDGGMHLDVDVSTPPNVSPYRVAVPLVNPSGENGDPIKATIELYGNVVSARWVDVPSGNLFAVVPGAFLGSWGTPRVSYPGVIPIGSDHEELSGGGDAGPFTPSTLGEMSIPARSYVELDVSTSTATAKFPKIASSGLMMTVCVIGPPENLSFPEGTVNIGHPSPVGGLSFATLLKRANGDWCVIWTQLPPTEGA